MANKTKPIAASILKADADALAALKKIAGYKPANGEFALDKLEASAKALKDADDAFAQTEANWQTERDTHVKAQRAFHGNMVNARQQVVAQYGDDSEEAQSVGLVKKSERGKRKSKAVAAVPAGAAA
jgi:hypothetical protein